MTCHGCCSPVVVAYLCEFGPVCYLCLYWNTGGVIFA